MEIAKAAGELPWDTLDHSSGLSGHAWDPQLCETLTRSWGSDINTRPTARELVGALEHQLQVLTQSNARVKVV